MITKEEIEHYNTLQRRRLPGIVKQLLKQEFPLIDFSVRLATGTEIYHHSLNVSFVCADEEQIEAVKAFVKDWNSYGNENEIDLTYDSIRYIEIRQPIVSWTMEEMFPGFHCEAPEVLLACGHQRFYGRNPEKLPKTVVCHECGQAATEKAEEERLAVLALLEGKQ